MIDKRSLARTHAKSTLWQAWSMQWMALSGRTLAYLGVLTFTVITLFVALIPLMIKVISTSRHPNELVLHSLLFLILIILADPICIAVEGLPSPGIGNAVVLASAFVLPSPLPFILFIVARAIDQQIPPRMKMPDRWFNCCLPVSILIVSSVVGIFQPMSAMLTVADTNLWVLPLVVMAAFILDATQVVMTSIYSALYDGQSVILLLKQRVKFDFVVSLAMTSSGALIAAVWAVSPLLSVLLVAPGAVFWSALKGVESKHEASVLTTFSDQLRGVLTAEAQVKFGDTETGLAVLPLLAASLSLTGALDASLYLRKVTSGQIEEALRCNKDGIVKDKIGSVLVSDDWDVVSQKNGVVIVPLLLSDTDGITGVIRLTGLTGTLLNSYQLEVLKILGAHAASTVENERLHSELQLLATRDPLTGTLNRRAFDETLQYEGNRINRYGPPMCLLYIDLDHFKSINDTSGHAAGDAALKAVSKALTASVRSVDSVGRLGGDEFAVLLPLTELCDGEVTAERIRANLAKIEAVDEGGNKIAVACSIGLASMPQHARNVKDLMASADRAVYAAKKSGRGIVSIADILAVDVAS